MRLTYFQFSSSISRFYHHAPHHKIKIYAEHFLPRSQLFTTSSNLVLCNRDADSLWSAVRLRISFRELGLRHEGGGLAPSVRVAAAPSWYVVSCPRGVGSDTSSGCLSQQRGPFSSRSTTRSKGEKRREKKIILKCEPWRKTRDKKEKYKNVAEITVLERRTVECVWSMSSLLGVW